VFPPESQPPLRGARKYQNKINAVNLLQGGCIQYFMSDQSDHRSDRDSPPTARDDERFYQLRDRSGWRVDRWLVALAVALMGCVKIPPASQAPDPAEFWVDAYAAPDGDGGVAAALKTLPRRPSAGVIHLRSGLYRGPFELEDDTTVIGHGQAVLFLEGEGVVATARGRVKFEHVAFQGGSVGLSSSGSTQLDEVTFSGHRAAAIELRDAGVTGRRVDVSGRTGSGIEAIASTIDLEKLRLSGSLSVGLQARSSSVSVRGVVSEGPATAVQSIGGRLTLEDVKAASGSRAAIATNDAETTLRRADVTGHEYGLLSKGGGLRVEGMTSRGAEIAGVAIVNASVALTNVTVLQSGSGGGLQLLDCESTGEGLLVDGARGTGLLLRKGRATIGTLRVRAVLADVGATDPTVSGDAVQVRDAQLELKRLLASELEGAGLVATNFASVRVGVVNVDTAATAAIRADRKSRVVASVVAASFIRGHVLAAFEGAQIDVGSLSARDVGNVAWADCLEGGSIRIGATDAGVEWQRCVTSPR
jgi:hypothetical protein